MTVQKSMWLFSQNGSIEGTATPNTNYQQQGIVGITTLGGAKSNSWRWIGALPLFSQPPREGRVLNASDTVLTAEMWADCTSILGAGGFACVADRITRADWDYLTSTWVIFKTANNWTTAGGDISTPQASFNSPTATGFQKITDQLVGLTNDAITSRSGLLIMRIKIATESAVDTQWAFRTDPDLESSTYLPARLIVTYESPQPGPTLMGLGAGII